MKKSKSKHDDTLICYCFYVYQKELEEIIREHQAKTVEEVKQHCYAGWGCQTCYADIEEIIHEYWDKKSKEKTS